MTTSPEFKVSKIDHTFLCSGHSYLPCDQDFGLIEKSKNIFQTFTFLTTGKRY